MKEQQSELETNRLLKDLVMETKTPEVPLFPGGASSGMGSSAGGEGEEGARDAGRVPGRG